MKVSCVGTTEELLKQKIEKFIKKTFLGTKSVEGFGRVSWLSCKIKNFLSEIPAIATVFLSECCPQCKKQTVIYNKLTKLKHCTSCNQAMKTKKFKIRAGIRADYPIVLQKFLLTLLLHDFVHTDKHPSKIYHEVVIEDELIRDACKNHHNGEESNNVFLPLVKYYDALASSITRRKPYQTIYRYNKLEGNIDLEQIKREIEEKQDNLVKVYVYIYESQELSRIVESMQYGKNDLRTHLLIMVNLAINDYYNKRLKISNGNISLSASNRDALATAMDAEMHSLSDHDNADLEGYNRPIEQKAGSIGRKEE
ncbi:MAG: hypothetical protein FK730_05385 [Asgard group archaeon]|nr:hypothetical protein [Asgard group archaeon]